MKTLLSTCSIKSLLIHLLQSSWIGSFKPPKLKGEGVEMTEKSERLIREWSHKSHIVSFSASVCVSGGRKRLWLISFGSLGIHWAYHSVPSTLHSLISTGNRGTVAHSGWKPRCALHPQDESSAHTISSHIKQQCSIWASESIYQQNMLTHLASVTQYQWRGRRRQQTLVPHMVTTMRNEFKKKKKE